MLSNGTRPEWLLAKEICPLGCQSWVITTLRNLAPRRLINGTSVSPSATANCPPGMKSYCMSMTSNAQLRSAGLAVRGMVGFLGLGRCVAHLSRLCGSELAREDFGSDTTNPHARFQSHCGAN